MIKTLKKPRIKEILLNIIKSIYDKPKASFKENGGNIKAFLLKFRTRQGNPFSPFLFKIVLESLARAIMQENKIKEIQVQKEKKSNYLFADGTKLYLENSKTY